MKRLNLSNLDKNYKCCEVQLVPAAMQSVTSYLFVGVKRFLKKIADDTRANG